MSQASFEEILRAWMLEYDERLPSDQKSRREAFIILFGNLQDHGFNKEDINSSRKEKIVRACVNPNHRDKKRLKRWISMVLNDLESSALVYYGTIKIRRDVVTPEMAAKLEGMEARAAEIKALRKPDSDEDDSGDSDDSDKPLNLDGDPLDLDSAVKDALDNQSTPSFELTDEVLKDINEPTVNWDEDFSKRFGLDNDEQS